MNRIVSSFSFCATAVLSPKHPGLRLPEMSNCRSETSKSSLFPPNFKPLSSDFMVQDISLLAKHDFSYYCNMCRTIQVVSAAVQILLIWSEAQQLSFVQFFIYIAMVGGFLYHVARRWYAKIDGRYDIRQLVAAKDLKTKVQYAGAVLLAFPLSLLIWNTVELENSFVHLVFYLCSFITVAVSAILLGMEAYEVFGKKNQ